MLLIDFINVGYGDGILIREKDSKVLFSMLVDCGNTTIGSTEDKNLKRIDVSDFLNKERIEHLDLVVLTHLHRDHIKKLAKLLKHVTLSELWSVYLPEPSRLHKRAKIDKTYSKRAKGVTRTLNMLMDGLEILSGRDCILRQVNHSHRSLKMTENLSVNIDCYHPYLYAFQKNVLDNALTGLTRGDDLDFIGEYFNISGIRLKLFYHGRNIILPADVSSAFWEDEEDQPCYILKVPHHASRSFVSEKLISTLQPEYSVVTVSNDRTDDRPSLSAIRLLQRYSKHVLFTDAVSVPGINPEYHQSVRLTIP